MKILNIIFLAILLTLPKAKAQLLKAPFHPQPFVHPGIYHNKADLDLMKKKILSGIEPYKSTFDRLNKPASADFTPKPFTHVIRGSYGSPAIGGSELSASAAEAYNQAIEWYVTGDQKHADKAIQIINAWSARLWDFDDNDAKLLAGWTGHQFCSAAEILRYSKSGWKQKDIEQFKHMLMAAYDPLIKDYFPEANGNWDAAIMDTRLAIAVFCDDHAMFDNVIEHYLRGEGNSGITKYIYPGGQCEESTRDMSHTQLGLGYLAQTCQIAWTQGIDLYAAANNRLAVGFEYTSAYMLGKDVPAYGVISKQGRGRFSDIYESVYHHYHDIKGLPMPYTAKAADTSGKRGGLNLLTSVRAQRISSSKHLNTNTTAADPGAVSLQAGAGDNAPAINTSSKVFKVSLSGSIQAALDSCANSGGWVVLAKGLYTLPASLHIPSGVTLCGQGKQTILFLDPKLNPGKTGTVMINATDDLHDVTLRDFVIEGGMTPKPKTADPNQDRRERSYQMADSRAGINFLGLYPGQMKNIRLERVTVSNCTKNGVAILGASGVIIIGCDFSDNGGSVVPGPGIHHNLLLAHVQGAEITGSRMDTSPWGNGIAVTESYNIRITGNEMARNKLNGIYVADCEKVNLEHNLTEGNDANGLSLNTLINGNSGVSLKSNYTQLNGKQGISIIGINGIVKNANILSNNGK